jgi:hypothetical protein
MYYRAHITVVDERLSLGRLRLPLVSLTRPPLGK